MFDQCKDGRAWRRFCCQAWLSAFYGANKISCLPRLLHVWASLYDLAVAGCKKLHLVSGDGRQWVQSFFCPPLRLLAPSNAAPRLFRNSPISFHSAHSEILQFAILFCTPTVKFSLAVYSVGRHFLWFVNVMCVILHYWCLSDVVSLQWMCQKVNNSTQIWSFPSPVLAAVQLFRELFLGHRMHITICDFPRPSSGALSIHFLMSGQNFSLLFSECLKTFHSKKEIINEMV